MTDKVKFEYVTVPLLTHATKQILDTWGFMTVPEE